MTKILIDGRPLFDVHSRDRGIGVFVRSLLEVLAGMPELSVAALVTAGTEVPSGIRAVTIHRMEPRRFAAQEHALRLPFDIRRFRPDVFHSPALEPPVRAGRAWIQTLHDVTPLLFDDPFFAREARHWRRTFRRMRAATAVVAVSEFSARSAVRLIGLDPSRVYVVPNGVDPVFRSVGSRIEADPPYLLSVGVYGPHKGYAEAIRVLDILASRGYPHRLKIVGTLNPWREAEIGRLLGLASHPHRVDLLGLVSRDELVRLYAGAAALIVTSRCEGFGLPALEGMASGTPVISFRNTALSEIVGDGGTLIDDGDAEAMATEVSRVIDDPGFGRALAERGRARSAGFDWTETAARYADIYRAVAAGGATTGGRPIGAGRAYRRRR